MELFEPLLLLCNYYYCYYSLSLLLLCYYYYCYYSLSLLLFNYYRLIYMGTTQYYSIYIISESCPFIYSVFSVKSYTHLHRFTSASLTVNKIARRARLGEFSIGQPYWFSLKQIMFIPTCSSDFSNFSFRAVRGPDSAPSAPHPQNLDTGHTARYARCQAVNRAGQGARLIHPVPY